MIPEAAVEAAEAVLLGYTGGCTCHEGYSGRNLIDPECSYHDVPPEVARLILEAAAPHMAARDEAKLAAIIVLLDPLERVTGWMATDDEAGRYAVEAINKIRAILDTP